MTPTDLTDLERRVAALESTVSEVGGVPSYVTVNADGSIGYNFTGHIHAQGLDLDEASNIATLTNVVQWLDNNGVTREKLTGLRSGAPSDHQLIIVAGDDATTHNSTIFMLGTEGAVGAGTQKILAQSGNQVRKLLADDGTSDYYQKTELQHLFDFVTTAENLTNVQTTYQDLTTVGPAITVPVNNGDYLFGFGATIGSIVAAGGRMGITGGGIGAATDNISALSTSGAVGQASVAYWRRFATVGSGSAVTCKYRNTGSGGTVGFSNRWLVSIGPL